MKKLLGLMSAGTLIFIGANTQTEEFKIEKFEEVKTISNIHSADHLAATNAIANGDVKDFAISESHAIIVTEDNFVYTAGRNYAGVLGINNSGDHNYSTWQRVSNSSSGSAHEFINGVTPIDQVVASNNNTGFVTSAGQSFIWGLANGGVSTIDHSVSTGTSYLPYNSASSVYGITEELSLSSNSVISSRRSGYSVRFGGNNSYGIAGSSNITVGSGMGSSAWIQPTVGRDGHENVSTNYKKLSAGVNNSYGLMDDGRLYGVGRMTYNQLTDIHGVEDTCYDSSANAIWCEYSSTYHRMLNSEGGTLDDVDDFAISKTSAVAGLLYRDFDGKMWGVGYNSSYSNGGSTLDPIRPEIMNDSEDKNGFVNGETEIVAFAVGTNNAFLADSDNNIYATGSSTGSSNITRGVAQADNHAPVKIIDAKELSLAPNDSIVKIEATSQGAAVLTELGALFMWGDNANGQQGIGVTATYTDLGLRGGDYTWHDNVSSTAKVVYEKTATNELTLTDFIAHFKQEDENGVLTNPNISRLSWKDEAIDSSVAGTYTLVMDSMELDIHVVDTTAPNIGAIEIKDRHGELVFEDDMTYTEVMLHVTDGSDISENKTVLRIDGEVVDHDGGFAIEKGGDYFVEVVTTDIYGNETILEYNLVMSKAVGSNIGPTAMGFIMVGGIMMLVIGAMWLNVKMAPRKMNYDGSWYS